MTIFRNNAEGGSDGTTVTVANSGGTSGDAFSAITAGCQVFDDAALRQGLLGYRHVPSSGVIREVTWNFTATTTAHCSFYWRRTGDATANHNIIQFRNAGGSAGVTQILAGTDGRLIVQNGSGTTVYNNAAANTTTNTWYRIEQRLIRGTTTSNGTIDWALYVGDSLTPQASFFSSAADADTTDLTNVRWGRPSGTTTDVMVEHWDSLQLFTDTDAVALGEPWPQDIVALSQASETNTADVLTVVKNLSLGQASESDTADTLTVVFVGDDLIEQALETDTANSLSAIKQLTISQVSETDVANGLTVSKLVSVGQVSETDVANVLTVFKQFSINQATETDIANGLTVSKHLTLTQVSETDIAQALSKTKIVALSQASETDLAQAFTSSIIILLIQIVETDVALSLTVYAPVYVLRVPFRAGVDYRGETYKGDPLMRHLGHVPQGVTVWRDTNGDYHEMFEGKPRHLLFDTRTEFYQGGRETPLTLQQRIDLAAAGYAAYIEELV